MATGDHRKDIRSIQMLRGIAALLVVLFHGSIQLQRTGYDADAFKWMQAGVDIFFVISGFIMWVTTEKAPDRTAGQFFLNRVQRIAPLYWLITFAMTALLVVAPRMLQSAVLDVPHILKSLFFIAAYNQGTHEYQPLLVPGWTLNLEMFFYVLFSIAIAVARGNRTIRLATVTLLIGGAAVLPMLVPGLPGAITFYLQPIIVEFLFGIILGWIYLARPIHLGFVGLAMAAAGFFLMGYNGYDNPYMPIYVATGLPALMVVGGALFGTQIKSRPLEWLGNVSYSLYLTHALVLSAFAQVWKRLGLFETAAPSAFYIVSTAICIIVAGIAYVTVEKPAQAIGRPRRTGAAPHPALSGATSRR
ncbi:MAG: hypothetical protein DI547_12885 [Sphingobium sp.]|jgi:exopolysaccharide production protein ExoZ|nr:MAG: hypothetical protein DI547_12885 [Sphingobium sp.]